MYDPEEEVSVKVTLTRREWTETYYALVCKQHGVEAGEYDLDDDPKCEDNEHLDKWAMILESATEKLGEALHKAKVDF